MDVQHGCLNDAAGCFNCYHFPAGQVICKNGFNFPINTYIYGDEVEDYDLTTMINEYVEGVDFTVEGELQEEELGRILDCLFISTSIKRRIKRLLFPS